MAEDRGRCELEFEDFKGMLLGFSPFEPLILLGEEGKGLDNAGKVLDKSSVIVSESHKLSYITKFLGDRPFHDGVSLFRVYL